MNIHKNARLTLARRLEMVEDLTVRHLPQATVAGSYAVSVPTVRKWLARYLAFGAGALRDASSRPWVSPRAIAPATALLIVELRRQRLTQARIATSVGVSKSTVNRVLRRAGLSRLRDLAPALPVQRYEHPTPGALLHIDIKKLGRIVRIGHRATGDPRHSVDGAGWEYLFVAVDDHARIAFTAMYPDETKISAEQFLHHAIGYFRSLGIRVQAILTDNGKSFHSELFRRACTEMRLRQRFTRPYRPQTNGKAERFIQSALREWAYGFVYENSLQRAAQLRAWNHHYNWHRPHQGIGGIAPMTRLRKSRNNLLTLHT
jgi:transposase InsO family protein